jgi:hypothetical protein
LIVCQNPREKKGIKEKEYAGHGNRETSGIIPRLIFQAKIAKIHKNSWYLI